MTAKPVVTTRTYTVQKGVPIPPGSGRYRVCPYPFLDMARGDSFLVKCEDTAAAVRAKASIRNWAKRFAKEHKGFVITQRSVEGGVRCWRLE